MIDETAPSSFVQRGIQAAVHAWYENHFQKIVSYDEEDDEGLVQISDALVTSGNDSGAYQRQYEHSTLCEI